MDENGIVTTFSDVSSADEAVARPKELAGEDQIDSSDGAIGERGHDGTLHLRDEAGDEADRALEHISRSIANGRTAVPADLDASAPAAVDAAMAVPDGPVTRYARTEVGAAEIAGAEDAAHEGSVKARDELHQERRRAPSRRRSSASCAGGAGIRFITEAVLEWTRFFGHSWAFAASRSPC